MNVVDTEESRAILKYMGWCKSRRSDTRFRGLDYDDVLSFAMESIWITHRWVRDRPEVLPEHFLRIATRILIRKVSSSLKKKRIRLLPWPDEEGGDKFDAVDSREVDPLVHLLIAEYVPPKRPASPCVDCGTIWGYFNKKRCRRPTRINGMCNACYFRSKYVPREAKVR